MKSLLSAVLASAASAALSTLALSTPANATLQLSISNGVSTFSCHDGQLGCDLSGGANNLLTVNTALGGFFVQLTLAQSSFGAHNVLQLSSANIVNEGGTPGTITFVASDTNFLAPVGSIQEAASLTFNDAVGSLASTLKFWADPLNAQGANPNNTPGPLLFSVSGTPLTDPDSFAGSHDSLFSALSPFSMTEGASLNLIAGGSITGFNESMTSSSAIPEPRTWAMLVAGFALMALLGVRRRVKDRFATL
jgi:hypothetical protein